MKRFLAAAFLLTLPWASIAQEGTGEVPPAEERPPVAEEVPSTGTPAEPVSEPPPAPSEPEASTSASAPAPAPAPAEAMPVVPAAGPVESQAGPGAAAALSDVADALEDFQGGFETVTEYAPAPLQPVLTAIAATLGAVLTLLGLHEWLKRRREKKTHRCDRCGGRTGDGGPCPTCGGAGKVEEEYEKTVTCPHCDGEGDDPCHACEGEGEKDGKPCETCGGTGLNGEEKCCTCLGKAEQDVTLKREVACPDCEGKGRR